MPKRSDEENGSVEMTDEEWQNQKLIGRELCRLRKALGLSEMDMAARMGPMYTGEFVARYESGSVPMEIGPFFAMLRVLHPNLRELTPKRLMARQISEEYLKLDAESQELLDLIARKFLSAQEEKRQNNVRE